MLLKGQDVILDIDVQGSLILKESDYKPVFIFLKPPSLNILKKRLRNRGTEDETTLQRRLHTARMEMEKIAYYDFIVINNILEETVKQIKLIIQKYRLTETERCVL